jgi:hypothetical protein
MCDMSCDGWFVLPALTGAAQLQNSGNNSTAATAAGNITKCIQTTVITAITNCGPDHYSSRHVPSSWPTTAPVAGVLDEPYGQLIPRSKVAVQARQST